MKDAAEQLRTCLTEAVELRVKTRRDFSVDFSGGIDSSRSRFALQHMDNDAALILSCHHYYHPQFPSGDLPYARRLARHDPRIQAALC